MTLIEQWSRAFPFTSEQLSQDPSPSEMVESSHLPFAREALFWREITRRVGALCGPRAGQWPDERRLAMTEQLLDVFAPVSSVGGRPALRARLRGLGPAQREAVSALMARLVDVDWMTRPWREAARLGGEDWLARVSPVDDGRLVWWWRKANDLEASGLLSGAGPLSASPVMTSIRRDHSELALRVQLAFDGVPPGRTTLVDAWNAGCVEEASRRVAHRGHWQEVPDAELWANPDGLSRLDAGAIHYYAPRLMLDLLRWSECSKRELAPLCDTFRMRLENGEVGRLDRLSAEQRELCALVAQALDG